MYGHLNFLAAKQMLYYIQISVQSVCQNWGLHLCTLPTDFFLPRLKCASDRFGLTVCL